jgi:hypothetical protein
VSISLFGFIFQLKLTFLIINSPAAAVTSADLRFLELRTPLHSSPGPISTVSICNGRKKVSSLLDSAPHLTQNSPNIFVLHDVPPAGDNQGRRGSDAPLDSLLVCSFAFESVEKMGAATVRSLLLLHLFYCY